MDIINPVNNIITNKTLQIQCNYFTKFCTKNNNSVYELYKD